MILCSINFEQKILEYFSVKIAILLKKKIIKFFKFFF